MQTAAQFYAAFDAAGFLVPCTWTPAGIGATPTTAKVRYRAETVESLSGMALASEPSIRYPKGQFAALKAGDLIAVTVDGGTLNFTAHEARAVNSGVEIEVLLRTA